MSEAERVILRPDLVQVDWIEVDQVHGIGHAPFCGECLVGTDPVTGEVTRRFLSFASVSGANGSNLQIRSDGYRVQVSGNPSRWGKPDDVFGLTFDDAMAVVQRVLASVGLPEFSNGVPGVVQVLSRRAKHGKRERDVPYGARFKRLDVTTNLETGSVPALESILRRLRAGRHWSGAEPCVDRGSLYFGRGSRHLEVLLYDKGRELRETRKRPGFVDLLAEHCEAVGVLRLELRLRRGLKSRNLRDWSGVTHDLLVAELQREVDFMTEQAEVSAIEDVPSPFAGTLALYLMGVDVKAKLSRNTWFAHRKRLLAYGYDIAIPSNVVQMRVPVRTVYIKQAAPPDWYRTAEDWLVLDAQEAAKAAVI